MDDEVIKPMENLSVKGEIQEQSLEERCKEVCEKIRKIQKYFHWGYFDDDTFWLENDSEKFTPQDPRLVKVEAAALRVLEDVVPGDVDVSEIETFLHWRLLIGESIALHNAYYVLWRKILLVRLNFMHKAQFEMGMSVEETDEQLPREMGEWKDKMQVMLDKIKGNPYINPKYGQDVMNNIY
jgi:hypothetical protein